MTHGTILYFQDQAARGNSVSAAPQGGGYEIVSTDSARQVVALLFIMHSVVAVVLNQRAREKAKFDVERSLRAIRPDVPIVLLCDDQIDRLPSDVDPCVSTAKLLATLDSAVCPW